MEASPELVQQYGFGFMISKAFLSSIELELFTKLDDQRLTEKDLSARIGIHSRSAGDFFDILVSMKLLGRENNLYFNTAMSKAFLNEKKPELYLGGLFKMFNDRLYGFWGNLTEALISGKPQNEVLSGNDLFDDLYKDVNKVRGFLQAMSGISVLSAHSLCDSIDWKNYRIVLDVGCAQGILPMVLCSRNDNVEVIGFDLPVVEEVFNEFVVEKGVDDRAKFHGGNFFTDPLPKADAIVFGHILHDWNLEQKKKLVMSAYQSLNDGGSIIVYEMMIDDERRQNTPALAMSLNMLIETVGGFDYTSKDCMAWLAEAGFKNLRCVKLAGPESAVIGDK